MLVMSSIGTNVFILFLDPYYQRSSVSKLCIHQTAAAKIHGGLFNPFHLFKLQAPLSYQSVEHGTDQVDRGVHRNRVELAGCHAGLQTSREISVQPAADFFNALAADVIRVLETGRTGTDRQIDLVGYLFDDIKMQVNEVFDFFELGVDVFRQVVQMSKKRFKGRCDDTGKQHIFARKVVIDHRFGDAGLF